MFNMWGKTMTDFREEMTSEVEDGWIGKEKMTRLETIKQITILCDELEQAYTHDDVFQRGRINYIKRNLLKLQRAEGEIKNETKERNN